MSEFSRPFRSYAQNQEDVVLWRAFADIEQGHYVEVGAYHPTIKSNTYAFYLRGWSGLLVEPQSEYVALLRSLRSEDAIVQAVVSDRSCETVPFYPVAGGARSTVNKELASKYGEFTITHVPSRTLNELLGKHVWAETDLHFLVLDVEGSERDALQGLDLNRFRPWVLVVESIDPITRVDSSGPWSRIITDHGYAEAAFDGVSRYYVAQEHSELASLLHPACSTDDYILDFPQLCDQPLLQSPGSAEGSRLEAEVISQLTDMSTVVGAAPHESVSTELVRHLANLSDESLTRLENVTLALQVAMSRARLLKSIESAHAEPREAGNDSQRSPE